MTKNLVNPKKGRRCWMDIAIDGAPPQRVVFELEWGECPKTCENFRALCAGDKGHVPEHPDVPLHYKGSRFHCSVPGFLVQGGDFTAGDGTGGWSIYGGSFADEFFVRAHSGPGMLAMANCGPNTNCSQFYVTLDASPHLNGRNMVFGRVVKGMSVFRKIEKCPTGEDDALDIDVTITDCGDLGKHEPDGVPIDPLDKWEDHPMDNLNPPDDNQRLDAAGEIRGAGNALFRSGEYASAAEKYIKAVQYLRTVRCRAEGDDAPKTVDDSGNELRVHRLVTQMRRRREEDDPKDFPDLDSSALRVDPDTFAKETGVLVDHGEVVAVLETRGERESRDDPGWTRVRLCHGNNEGKEGWIKSRDLHMLAAVENQKRYPNKAEVVTAKVSCYSNRATCYAKLKRWADTKRASREALKLDEGNAKVLFRHAEALFELKDDDDVALEYAQKAAKLAPDDDAVQKLIERISTRIKRFKKKFGTKMGEAIDRLGEAPPRPEVRFKDRETLREAVVFCPKRLHVTYSLDGKDRDADRELVYDPQDKQGPLVRFPNIRKKINLPNDKGALRELIPKLREMLDDQGVRHNLPGARESINPLFPLCTAPAP